MLKRYSTETDEDIAVLYFMNMSLIVFHYSLNQTVSDLLISYKLFITCIFNRPPTVPVMVISGFEPFFMLLHH